MRSYDSLRLTPGQGVTRLLWNKLISILSANTPRPGRNVTMRRLSKGTIFSFHGKGGGIGQTGMFLMSLDAGQRGVGVLTIGKGLIGGIMPVVMDKELLPIFNPKKPDEQPPQLTVIESDFKDGICSIFAKVTVDPVGAFFPKQVEIIASAGLGRPPFEPATAFKLLGWLSSPDGNPQNADVLQMCHHNQAFVATNINPATKTFRPFFIAE